MADLAGQARLAALVEYSSDAVMLADRDGAVIWVSPSTLEVLGHSPGGLVGTNLRDLWPSDDPSGWPQCLSRALDAPGEPVAGKGRCRHGDGAWRWVEGVARSLLDDPRIAATVISVRDVTERESADEARRGQDARYCRLVTDAPDLIMETDQEGRLRFVNPSGLRLMGFTLDQVIDRPFTEFIREDYRPAILAHYRRQVEHREPSSYIEVPVVAADGSQLWLGQHAWLMVEEGRYRGFQSLAHDITDRMRLEEQLLQARKMEAVGRLAGGIAHDFNNLLAAIRGNAELLLHVGEQAPGVVEGLEAIVLSADRAASLTRQLLVFSRKQVVNVGPLDLNDVVASAERFMRRRTGAAIELSLVLAPSLPQVIADRGPVEQVLFNLVTNARDVLPAGGRITVRTVNVVLVEGRAETVRTGLPPGGYVCLEVADNGPGMDEATQARIFEPFFTTKEPGRGTGLGLATAYGLVRQMAGAITVSSRLERGTRFRMYLPAAGEGDRVDEGAGS